MELIEAIKIRHSVRNFTDEPVAQEIIYGLKSLAEQYNQSAGLHIQIITDDPEAFTKGMAHYGKFSGVRNYIALVGGKTRNLEEKLGYFGEKMALSLTQQDIQFCWVGLTFSKKTNRVEVGKGEKYVGVICFGHGTSRGISHKIKAREEVMEAENAPQWFLDGVDAALLAPTAMNQQKFIFILKPDGKVDAKSGHGLFADVDLGIAKYHFEIGAGRPAVSVRQHTTANDEKVRTYGNVKLFLR
ncbi:MAG: nitroreductase family protein [Bacteroidales bacterium]|nr:nitroreductase family protein [Bacteroidales bacterium]MDY6002602.1 nitroreductase family protein [Candidatus Cryptobacteroides sp.]